MADETKNPETETSQEETVATEQTEAPKADKKAKKAKGGDAAKLAAAEEAYAKACEDGDKVKDQLLRVTAEYDNFRKRSQKEHDAAFSNGVAHAAEMLLPVLDVLDAAANAQTSDEEYKKGVVMTLDKAREVFAKMGITEIDAMGQPFDPEVHNACMQEACEGTDSGCITRVVQKGYSLNGRVIRHAMVAVAP